MKVSTVAPDVTRWLLFALTLFTAGTAGATCSVSVSASATGTGIVGTATSSGTCGGSSIDVYLDGLGGRLLGSRRCGTPSCTVNFEYTSCVVPGTHNLDAFGGCNKLQPDNSCRSDLLEHEVTQVTVPKSQVSVSYEKVEETGQGRALVSYEFFNAGTARELFLELDGGLVAGHSPPTSSGVWPHDLNTACLTGQHTLRATARQCHDEASKAVAETTFSADSLPKASVSLRKAGGAIEGTLVYDMGEGTGWTIEAHKLEWVLADGTIVPGGEIFSQTPSSRTGTRPFTVTGAPAGARQVIVTGAATSCYGRTTSQASIECGCDSTGDPVYLADGNVRVTDADPLPAIAGHGLVRTYDSDEQDTALFGRGWTSLFEQRLIFNTDGAEQLVSVATGTNEVVTFRGAAGVFRQTAPTAHAARGTLEYDAATDTYAHREAGSQEVAVFRADGKLSALRDRATGREATIGYDAAGRPQSLTDSWSGTSWSLTMDGPHRRVTSIAVSGRPDLVWSYAYDGAGNLLTVTAPGQKVWRTYEYASNRMTASRDGAGNLIESHTYDAAGYGISSTGPTDEIASIEYDLPGTVPGERVTRLTYKNGNVAEHVMRPAGGAYRVVQVTGGCTSCGGGGERTSVYDDNGRIVREQSADGYVTAREYDAEHLVAEERFLRPANCDPATDPAHCRMNHDALAAAALQATGATMRTTFEYSDPLWPDRVTASETPSVVAPGGVRRESYAFHPVTGTLVRTSVRGWTGEAPQEEKERAMSRTLYGDAVPCDPEPCSGGEALAPAFDPGGAFQSAWLSLPQPAGVLRSEDGSRTDVQDGTWFVHYPLDGSVPALLRGRLAATKNAAGHITRFEEYDVFGNVTRQVDANGVVYETEHDAMGRLSASTVKGIPGCDTAADVLCGTDLTSTRGYLDAGPLRVEQRPLGGVNVSAYDDRGRVRTVSRGPAESDLRERIEINYDPLTGKKSMERRLAYVSGAWTETRRESYAYDSRGRLQTVMHADGAAVHYTYDADDRVATMRDETHASANTIYAYDPAGRLASVRQTLAGAPNGQITTSYGYDIHGNVTAVTDPNGNATTYAYDDFGQMLSQQSPVSGTTTYRYDEAGNLTEVTDGNGAVTVRQYDVMNRVTSATTTRGQTSEVVSWSYDDATAGRFAIGRLSGMNDPAGSVEYRYERRGLLRQETRATPDGATYVQRYAYDADRNRNATSYPSGRVVTYQHDYAGRPLTATGTMGGQNTPYVTAATYLPFGPLTSLGLGDGTVETWTFNVRYLPAASNLTRGATTIAQYAYTHDPAGNITSITDGVDAGYTRTFGYDDLHRLVTANTGSSLWGAGSFTYDRMGNMLTATLGASQRTFTHEGTTPRIRTATGLSGTMSYDDAGNELDSPAGEATLGGSTAVQYSPRNLVQAQLLRTYDRCFEEHGSACTQPDPAEEWQWNVYDGRGVRVLSSRIIVAGSIGLDPSQTHAYFYTPELAMLNIVSHATGRTADVIWFGSRPVADHGDSEVRYTYTDHLGTPILQTTASGTVTWRAEHEPYGSVYALRSGAANDDQPLRFPGQQVSYSTSGGEESYNIFRWYRAGWGRYTQADPIGMAAGTNLFGYAVANPLGYIDPEGLKGLPIPPRPPTGVCPAPPRSPKLGFGWRGGLLAVLANVIFTPGESNSAESEAYRPDCPSCPEKDESPEQRRDRENKCRARYEKSLAWITQFLEPKPLKAAKLMEWAYLALQLCYQGVDVTFPGEGPAW